MNDYDKAIEELKRKFPEYKNNTFEMCDGELINHGNPYFNMEKPQNEINKILGQKEYMVDLVYYASCYARNENEVREFINRSKLIETHIDKIYKIPDEN